MMWFHKQVMMKKKSAGGMLSYLFLVFVLLLCTPTTIDCSSSMDQEYRRCRELNSNTNRKYYSSGVVLDDTTTTTTGGGGEGASRRNHTSQRVRQQRQGTIPIVPSLQGFYDSTCEVCPMNDDGTFKILATEPIAINFDINQTKVVILALSPSSSFEKTMIVAAGLLSSQAHVTIITGPHMPDTLLIRQVLFQHIPCRQHLMASMLLDFQQLNIDTNQLPCPSLISSIMMMQLQQQQQHQHNNHQSMGGSSSSLPPELQKSTGDILLCNIQNSEILVTAIRNVLNRIMTKPTLFLMDATCMAGILVAEQLHIPAVLMIEEADVFLQHILGTPKLSILSSSTTGIVIPSILNSKSSTTSIPSSTTNTDTSSTIITVMQDTIWNLIHYWNPRSLYHTISIGIQDRLNSLDLTSSFMAFNRIRTKYKLQRIRHVVDMWKVGGCVLLANSHTTIIKHDQIKTTVGSDSDTYYDYVIVERIIDNDDTTNNNYGRDDGTGWSTAFPNLYTIPDPLLPPCISCTNEPITTRRDTATSRMKRTMTSMENKSKQKHRKADTVRKAATTATQSSDTDDSYDENDDESNIPRIVLSVAFRNDEKGRSGSRRLMLGFWLAKQSILHLSKSPCNTTTSYDDDNQTRSTTATADLALAAPFSTSTCWNGPTDFRLVRPGSMPEVLPPGNDNVNDDFLTTTNNNFVTAEETSFLDTLARHQPIAMVSVCDSSNTWTQSLGPPVICLDTSWPARKIAFSIVSLLRNINSTYTRPMNNEHNQNERSSNATMQSTNQHRLQNVEENTNSTSSEPSASTSNGLDGLEWIVSLMDRLSSLHDEKNHVWQSGRQMFHDVLLELEMMTGGDGLGEPRQEERQSHETIPHLITVYLAWIILMSSILYLPLKDPMITLQGQLNRRLHHQRHSNSTSNHTSNATTNNRHAGSKTNGEIADHDVLDDHDLRFSSIGTEMYYRLPDLDLAWNMWTWWVRDTVQWMRVTIDEGWQQPFYGDDDEVEEDKRQHLKKNGSRKHSSTTASTPINGFSHHHQQPRPGVAKSSFATSDEVLVNGSNGSTMRKRRTAKKRH